MLPYVVEGGLIVCVLVGAVAEAARHLAQRLLNLARGYGLSLDIRYYV